MTAARIFGSVTNGGTRDFAEVAIDQERRLSKRNKHELDFLRIAEAYPNLRALIPADMIAQLP